MSHRLISPIPISERFFVRCIVLLTISYILFLFILYIYMHYKLLSVLTTQIVMWVLLFLMLFPQNTIWSDPLWIGASIIFLIYLPGYWIWYIFFGSESLTAFERFIMNFLLSITCLILISYYLYYTNIQLSDMMIYLITFVIILLSIIIVLFRWRWDREILDEDMEI